MRERKKQILGNHSLGNGEERYSKSVIKEIAVPGLKKLTYSFLKALVQSKGFFVCTLRKKYPEHEEKTFSAWTFKHKCYLIVLLYPNY